MITHRLWLNRRGLFWVRFESGPANGCGVHIRTLLRWTRAKKPLEAD